MIFQFRSAGATNEPPHARDNVPCVAAPAHPNPKKQEPIGNVLAFGMRTSPWEAKLPAAIGLE
jgi:hypothetical protein